MDREQLETEPFGNASDSDDELDQALQQLALTTGPYQAPGDPQRIADVAAAQAYADHAAQGPADQFRMFFGDAFPVLPARPRDAALLAEEGDAQPERAQEDNQPRRRFRRGVNDAALEREAEGEIPTDGLAWTTAHHALWTSRLLTFDDPRAPDPPGFKGHLYPPQATLLAAMLALERRPLLGINDGRAAPEWGASMQARVARVSERFSFGKTVLALALVCAQRVPARLPEQMPLMTYAVSGASARTNNRAYVTTARGGGGNFDTIGQGFLPEVSLRYGRFLPVTLVAATANVISQWEENTKQFTDLRYVIVEDVRGLRAFEAMYRKGEVADLDLIFLKAGRVTTSFVVGGEPKHEGRAKNRSLFEAVARILEGVTLARKIIDDYDTLKLLHDDCFVPSLFTWVVSATRRQTTAKVVLRTGARTVEDFFRANLTTSFPILGAALDDVLNKVFSLHCAPAYVDAHINSTALGFRRIFVQGGQAAAILRDLEVPEEVVEMVNADAVGTAAETLGLNAKSVADVIHRVVGNHLDRLRHAVRALVRAERARRELGAKAGHEKDREVVKALRATLKDGGDAAVDDALRSAAGLSSEVNAALASLEEWATAQKDKHGQALARMRDNIREGHCQCCQVPFEKGEEAEAAYVLAGCCQIIVCEPCITRRDGGKKSFIKRCPNCARDIKLDTGLVRVGAELDLEAALTDEAVISDAPDAPAPPSGPAPGEPEQPPNAPDPYDAIENQKLRALLQLVRGRPIDCLRDVATPPYVTGLLDGRRNAPWPAHKPKKFLIFTMHSESTAFLHGELARLKKPHCILRGTRSQKDEAVRQLQSEVDIMLVTTPKDCGGLNLPFLSHVVFYHRVLDKNVEAQVAARGQRLGREHNLEIVTLVNEAEAEGL